MTGRIWRALLWGTLLLLAFAHGADADQQVSQTGEGVQQTLGPRGLAMDFETGRLYVADMGNNRISRFNALNSFELALGWGVMDGAAELQTCGPGGVPAGTACRRGLAGGGAGELVGATEVAVDNDGASANQNSVYVLDGKRVQKFSPQGVFLGAWGGGVATGGAKGLGNLVTGSPEITNVETTAKNFEVGQEVEA